LLTSSVLDTIVSGRTLCVKNAAHMESWRKTAEKDAPHTQPGNH